MFDFGFNSAFRKFPVVGKVLHKRSTIKGKYVTDSDLKRALPFKPRGKYSMNKLRELRRLRGVGPARKIVK